MDIKNIYYIAGLLEGEGCFGFYGCPSIQINMTDLDTIEKAKLILDIRNKNIVRMQNKGAKNYKNSFTLNVSGDVAIQWMMTLYPLMSIRRKEKIKEIIGKWIPLESADIRIDKGHAKGRLILTLSKANNISIEKAREIIEKSI